MQCESEWFQILVCCSSHCYDGQAIVDGLYTPYLDVCFEYTQDFNAV